MYSYSRNLVEIDRKALQHNYRVLKQELGEEKTLLAMIKADAYGHGMVEAAQALTEIGCDTFGVAEIGEAVELRQAGCSQKILIFLGFCPEEAELLFDYSITPILYSEDDFRLLDQIGAKKGRSISVYLKVDTGMSRLGVFPDQVGYYVKLVKQLPNIELLGMVSHMARADEKDAESNTIAINHFVSLMHEFDLSGSHLANSGGVLNLKESHFSFGRAGICLYGYYPDGQNHPEITGEKRLQPVMRYSTSVLQVKTIAAGQGISYGHTYIPEQDITIAILPIGYEDGFNRQLSNKGEVLIRGKRAPVIGRVCMNLCMIDVSHIEGVSAGDEVVVIGTQGDETITAEELAEKCNTISYEILCMIGNSNKRVYR